jgi:L-ribulose-5-phosphate 3-epimerase
MTLTIISCDAQTRSSDGSVRWTTGVALYSFNKFSFADAIKKAHSANVKFVEGFSFHKLGSEFNDKTMANATREDIASMKQIMRAAGIKMRSMYVGGAKNKSDWLRFFEMAKQFDMQYLVCEPGREHWNMVDSLAGIFKIKIAIHQHSRESGSIYWHPDSVLSAVKGHANIGACADLGHWARSGLDPTECLRKLQGHILGIHLKDIDQFHHKANDVLVGTGVINFPDVVSELKSQNFDRMVYVECEHEMNNNLADVQEAIRYFKHLADESAK